MLTFDYRCFKHFGVKTKIRHYLFTFLINYLSLLLIIYDTFLTFILYVYCLILVLLLIHLNNLVQSLSIELIEQHDFHQQYIFGDIYYYFYF